MKQTATAAHSQASSSVIGVPANRVGAVWEMVKDTLGRAVDMNDGFTLDDILQRLLSRDMQLWLSVTDENEVEAVGVTVIEVYPRNKVCLLLFLAGKMTENWLSFQPQLENWALAQGCNELRFIGRKGWAKIASDFTTDTLYRKRLGELS